MLNNDDLDKLIAGFNRPVSVLLSEQLALIGKLIERGLSYQQIAQVLSGEIKRPVSKSQIYKTVKRFISGDPTLERRYQIASGIQKYLSSIPRFDLDTNSATRNSSMEGNQTDGNSKKALHESRMQRLQSQAAVSGKPKLAKADPSIDCWSDAN